MRAGVALADAMQAAGDKRPGKILIMPNCLQMACHLGGAARCQKILARAEQALLVPPGRAHQRDAAGQRLEHPDRGDPRQSLHVGPARDMDGHPMLSEGRGRLGVGKPALISDAGPGQRLKRLGRVADAVDGAVQLGLTRRLDQEIVQFLGALAITPVANPDEVLLRPLGQQRVEHGRVGSLMPGEDPPSPAQPLIAAAQGVTECQHRVIVRQR